ncbi:MAG: methyltransferase domain-containing protein [Polyangiaceae bacterium]
MSSPNDAQQHYWNEVAGPIWVQEKARLDRFSEPFLSAALRRLALEAGQSVLDVGCGTGASTAALAERVGPSGRVLGVDISRVMLDAAERALASHANVQLREEDAQTYRPESSVDFVFSRFGVMFFADPRAAFENLGQGLREGGQLGFLCWRGREDNEWATFATEAAAEVIDVPTLDPAAPGPFRMARGGATVELLIEAGFDDVGVEALDQQVSFTLSDANEFMTRVGPMAAFLREADETTAKALREALASALARRAQEGSVTFRAGAWWVSATRGEL